MRKTSNDIPLGAKPINRAAHRRREEAWLAEAQAQENVLVCLLQAGELYVGHSGDGLVWLGEEARRLEGERIFLGEDKNGSPIFAIDLPAGTGADTSLIDGLGEFADMRRSAARLGLLEANLASTARSIFEWHRSHQFCSKCGAESDITEAGWKRVCPNCGAEHFPRTDPVAIMLPIKGDKCLLGRSPGWPKGFYSCLAGFVEPGETIEQAAAREVEEEAGIICNPESAEYLFCQPWPFPSSLMVGLHLQAETEEINVDPLELEDAIWITREEAKDVLKGNHPKINSPFPMAIAFHVLKEWADPE